MKCITAVLDTAVYSLLEIPISMCMTKFQKEQSSKNSDKIYIICYKKYPAPTENGDKASPLHIPQVKSRHP